MEECELVIPGKKEMNYCKLGLDLPISVNESDFIICEGFISLKLRVL